MLNQQLKPSKQASKQSSVTLAPYAEQHTQARLSNSLYCASKCVLPSYVQRIYGIPSKLCSVQAVLIAALLSFFNAGPLAPTFGLGQQQRS